MSKNKFKILCVFFIFFAIVFLLPFPQRLNYELKASMDNNEHTVYNLTVKGWKLDYMFKKDIIIPEVKLYADNVLIDTTDDIQRTYIYKAVPDDITSGVEYASFSYYNSAKAEYEPVNMWYDLSNGRFLLNTEDFVCAAPAYNDRDAHTIVDYFKQNNYDSASAVNTD